MDDRDHPWDDPVELPIDGELDLHTFPPEEVKDLVIDYLAECRRRGITVVRIVHGKGTGALRATVYATLEKIPEVIRYVPAPESRGGWGATMVYLRPTSLK
jgi:DNA-nicking Smr family endonuclease